MYAWQPDTTDTAGGQGSGNDGARRCIGGNSNG
jgi:hypothetical protein